MGGQDIQPARRVQLATDKATHGTHAQVRMDRCLVHG